MIPPDERSRRLRRAEWLVILSLLGHVAAGVLALWAGDRADSVALLAFGIESLIQLMAGTIVLWRLLVERSVAGEHNIDVAERRAQRLVSGIFWLLALYLMAHAGFMLWRQTPAATSTVGLLLAVLSLALMPLLAGAKIKAARALESAALAADAQQTLSSAYLALCLLAGLGLNAWLGWWWADPVGALAMVPWLLQEGRERIKLAP
jgi:divalent metal cation (Fe/Co/Zn/Cd) transporter